MALDNDTILAAIRDELAGMKVPDAEGATEATTWKELDVDSLELVELVKALEDRFGIVIADGRLKSIESVGDAVALVKELDAEGATATS